MSYGYYTYQKSSVIGGSWSTPFGTPFFIRCGDWSLKVPMAQLRAEYDAWEKLQLERREHAEPPQPAPLPSFPSGPFNWAEDVEQELFSDASNDVCNTNINLENNTGIDLNSNLDINFDGKPNIDPVFSPIVGQVVPEGVAVVGAGTILCTIPEEGEEEGVTGEDEASDLDSIDLTDSDSDSTPRAHSTDPDSTDCDTTSLDDSDLAPLDDSASPDDSTPRIASTPLDDSTPRPTSTLSTGTNTTVYRIINVSTADSTFSINMVEDDTASDTSNSTTPAQELYEAIRFLGTVGLLNLDTYATVFDTAARACATGPPFWLHDPLGDREIVV